MVFLQTFSDLCPSSPAQAEKQEHVPPVNLRVVVVQSRALRNLQLAGLPFCCWSPPEPRLSVCSLACVFLWSRRIKSDQLIGGEACSLVAVESDLGLPAKMA